ncbi:MAG: hypothetical protein V4563_12150 [Pseudomonadota bacterium]
MPKFSKRLVRAVEKSLNDLSNGILKRRTYNAFLELRTGHSLDFFRIAIHALHDDLYADAHRVFDTHKDTASICYIRRVAPGPFNRAVKAAGVSVPELEQIASKLLHIRNRVQFHTAKRDVEVPAKVWEDARMSGNEFIRLTEQTHEVLRLVYLELTGENKTVPDYFGEDIEPILRAYKEAKPNAPLRIRGRKV